MYSSYDYFSPHLVTIEYISHFNRLFNLSECETKYVEHYVGNHLGP